MELLEQWDSFAIHTAYYISRHVNASLQRCFGLAPHRIDISSWYEECPKPRRRIHFWPVTRSGNSVMISSYFGSDTCALCGAKCHASGRSRAAVCENCRRDSVSASYIAFQRLRAAQQSAMSVAMRCRDCNLCVEDASTFGAVRPLDSRSMGRQTTIVTPLANCSCIDCPSTYERHRLREAELEAGAICQALSLI